MSFHPQGKGSVPPEKTRETYSMSPPSSPFLFLSIIWPLDLSSRMSLKAWYGFSSYTRSYPPTFNLPLSRSLKTQFEKKKKKEKWLPTSFLGLGWSSSSLRRQSAKLLGRNNRDALITQFWYEHTCSFICVWGLFKPRTPNSYWKEKVGNQIVFFFFPKLEGCFVGKWTSSLLGLHIFQEPSSWSFQAEILWLITSSTHAFIDIIIY